MSVPEMDPTQLGKIDISQMKKDVVKVKVVGVYKIEKGEEIPKGISQEFSFTAPPQSTYDQAAILVAESINKNGIVVKRNEYVYDMYAAGSFDRVNIEFQQVTGVTL